jgi:hypothetical protein
MSLDTAGSTEAARLREPPGRSYSASHRLATVLHISPMVVLLYLTNATFLLPIYSLIYFCCPWLQAFCSVTLFARLIAFSFSLHGTILRRAGGGLGSAIETEANSCCA